MPFLLRSDAGGWASTSEMRNETNWWLSYRDGDAYIPSTRLITAPSNLSNSPRPLPTDSTIIIIHVLFFSDIPLILFIEEVKSEQCAIRSNNNTLWLWCDIRRWLLIFSGKRPITLISFDPFFLLSVYQFFHTHTPTRKVTLTNCTYDMHP